MGDENIVLESPSIYTKVSPGVTKELTNDREEKKVQLSTHKPQPSYPYPLTVGQPTRKPRYMLFTEILSHQQNARRAKFLTEIPLPYHIVLWCGEVR